MILLTDGAGNISMTDIPVQDEALKAEEFYQTVRGELKGPAPQIGPLNPPSSLFL